MRVIAYIHNDFSTKFGVPRQSGLVPQLMSEIVFEPEFRVAEALRGIEEFSHLWIIWEFHQAKRESWSPTVRPPRLGGNTRKGVFATRSPFRPNPIGLTCVKLERVLDTPNGKTLLVSGADLMDGTPIYDIKPYIPYADAHPEATGSFAAEHENDRLQVNCPPECLSVLTEPQRAALLEALAQDPRPAYQHDPDRIYGFPYGKWEVRFTVRDNCLTVVEMK